VIASSIGATAASSKVKDKYDHLIRNLGPEFFILREASLKDIEMVAGPFIGEGMRRLRRGQGKYNLDMTGNTAKLISWIKARSRCFQAS
jgi:PHP family Zn ribbon phosphoesterase